MDDSYKTLRGASQGLYKEKGSKFHAYAYPILSKQDIDQYLGSLQKEHPKARHHCYAYRLGLDGNNFRANDDGEPRNSAGTPILNTVDSAKLSNVLIVVVRYFGGTKLGIPGLIRSYKTAAKDAIKAGTVVNKVIQEQYELQFEFDVLSDVMNLLKRLAVKILKQDLSGPCKLSIAVRPSERDLVLEKLSLISNLQYSSING